MLFQRQSCASILDRGLLDLGLSISGSVQSQLIDYLELLAQWNAVHNLSAVRDPVAMVRHHLLDSLAILPYLSQGRWLDVGTGAGLPGIPLALCLPEYSFVLLDSTQKKICFVDHVLISLKLSHVRAVCARVETYAEQGSFDGILCRAFSSVSAFVQASRSLCRIGGQFLSMKGTMELADSECAALPPGVQLEGIRSLRVPGLDRARSLAMLRRMN